MRNTKKSVMRMTFSTVLVVPLLLIMALFAGVGIFQIGDEFLIQRLENTTQNVTDQLNVSNNITDQLGTYKQKFRDDQPPFDLIFMVIFLTAFLGTSAAALKAPPLPQISWLGVLVFGTMLVLVFLFYIEQVASYIIDDFFFQVFDRAAVDIPFFNWFFENTSIVITLWFVLLLMLNQMKINLPGLTNSDEGGGRVEK